MSAEPTAVYEPNIAQREKLLERHGEKLFPRLVAFGLSLRVEKERVLEAAQHALAHFANGGRRPKIDPAEEYESLRAHLSGSLRSALKRKRWERGHVKVTTTGGDRVPRREGDAPASAPGMVLEAPRSASPDRLAETRDAYEKVLLELRAELPGNTLAHRMIDLLHLDLDPAELAEQLGVPVLAIYKTNRRIEEAKVRLRQKKQKEAAS